MKFPLTQEQKLKIYSARVTQKDVSQGAFAVGYSAEDATQALSQKFNSAIIQITGFTPLEPILQDLKIEPETSKEQFIMNLQLCADKFVEDKRDKTSIKRILNKL